jgi:hypothetical protein
MAVVRRQSWLSKKQRLDRLFAHYERLPDEDEIRSHWVRYLVILTSGLLETTVEFIYTEYTAAKSAPRVSKFVARRLAKGGNLGMNKLEQIVRDFDDLWFQQLQQHTDFDEISSAVESVVSNRNRVAHGEDITLTFTQLSGYNDRILNLLDLIADQCDEDMQRRRRL